MSKLVVLATGGFDPLHTGHIKLFKEAKKLGDFLMVGVNSDEWLTRKKGKPFMPMSERKVIVGELKVVDNVLEFDDSDDSACDAIQHILDISDWDVVFVNGGDRTKENIPELDRFLGHDRVNFAWGVGGHEKTNSSSWILKQWNE